MFGNGRLFRKVDSKVTNLVPTLRQCRAKSTVENKVFIPSRIERDSTDVLKALASTVKLDPTAFHYKYVDDPHMYPYSIANKRVFALAKESGKISAEWIIKENPGFFKHKLADPPIEAFIQKNKNAKEVEGTEKELVNAIEERDVLSAIEVYKAVKSRNEDLQASTKQSLLELLCFYNGEEKPNAGVEERWYEGFLGKAGASVSNTKKWNKNSLAVSLFEEMDPLCPLANSAMIQGLLKYEEINKAMQLYDTAKANKIQLSVGVYNAILENSRLIVNEQRDTYSFVRSTLTEMAKQRVRPNLGTLNAALNALHKTYHSEMALKMTKEFLNLNIEPSLGSYGYLFRVIARAKHSPDPVFYKNVVEELMNVIENQEHEILHPSDFKFFLNSATAFAEGLEDPDLSLRLHEMYVNPSFRKFCVKAGDDHGFYKMIMRLLFQKKPIDFAMDFYRRYKYTVTSPESSVLKEIICAIHENLSSEYLAELWKDLPELRYQKQRPVLMHILSMMKDFSDELSLNVFYEAALIYFNLLSTDRNSMMSGDQDALPFILSVLVKKEDVKTIGKVIEFIEENDIHFINMDENTVKSLFEFAIEKKNISLIRGSLKLASREDSASIREMVERALPYLEGSDALWVKTLAPEGAKRNRQKTIKDINS